MALFLERPYREVAIADCGELVLGIPTDTLLSAHSPNPFALVHPQRVYSRKGWFFHRDKWLGLVHDLRFNNEQDEWLEAMPHISTSLSTEDAISFEVNSWRSLPAAIAQQATLTYRFETDSQSDSYRSLFRQVHPQQIKVYPFKSLQQFSKQIRWLREEQRHSQRMNRP